MSRYSLTFQPDSGRIEARTFRSDDDVVTSIVKEDLTIEVLTAVARWLTQDMDVHVGYRFMGIDGIVYELGARIVE